MLYQKCHQFSQNCPISIPKKGGWSGKSQLTKCVTVDKWKNKIEKKITYHSKIPMTSTRVICWLIRDTRELWQGEVALMKSRWLTVCIAHKLPNLREQDVRIVGRIKGMILQASEGSLKLKTHVTSAGTQGLGAWLFLWSLPQCDLPLSYLPGDT